VHEKPVGPHPDWSCQLAFRPDHRDRAMWMGAVRPLDLSILDEAPVTYDL
jgi:aromatic ring-cleaving dioxygenase